MHATHLPDEKLLSITSPEREALLPLGKTKIFELIRKGELPAIKVGKRTFLRVGDVRRFVAAHSTAATAK